LDGPRGQDEAGGRARRAGRGRPRAGRPAPTRDALVRNVEHVEHVEHRRSGPVFLFHIQVVECGTGMWNGPRGPRRPRLGGRLDARTPGRPAGPGAWTAMSRPPRTRLDELVPSRRTSRPHGGPGRPRTGPAGGHISTSVPLPVRRPAGPPAGRGRGRAGARRDDHSAGVDHGDHERHNNLRENGGHKSSRTPGHPPAARPASGPAPDLIRSRSPEHRKAPGGLVQAPGGRSPALRILSQTGMA
jgi:hypothetical protein